MKAKTNVSIIRAARQKRGWSQLELCHRSRLSYNTVAFAERGTICTPETAQKLSRALGVTIKANVHDRARGVFKKNKVVPTKFSRRRKEEKQAKKELAKLTKKIAKAMEEQKLTVVREDVADVVDPNGFEVAGQSVADQGASEPASVGSAATERDEASDGIQPTDIVPTS